MSPESFIVLILALTVGTAWFFALLVWSDRRHARHMLDREAERMDRQMIMQRVQAPELAPAQHMAQMDPMPQPQQHVPFDNDEAYWAAQERQDEMLAGLGLNNLGAE